jgi:membrane protein DedA with SNARE-associated domain
MTVRNGSLRPPVLVLASITDSVADWAIQVVRDLGLPGIFLLMTPESACIPIPSEPTMLFAGFAVHNGEYSVIAAVLVASVANLVGSWIAYAAGYYGRVELLQERRFIHLSPRHMAWADRWFERYGAPAVFFARMLPIIRTFISLPAGIARMRFSTFSLLTFLGALPWNLALVLTGRAAASHWEDWKHRLHYVDYVVLALLLVGAAYLLVRRRRNGRDAAPA